MSNSAILNPLNIVITGGSSGIGKALVCRFASAGHRVLTTYYNNEESVSSIKRQFRNVDYCFLDQGNLDSVESFTENVRNWLRLDLPLEIDTRRTVDVLINNAALGSATVIPYIQEKYNREAPANGKTFEDLSDLRKKALEDEALMKVNALGPLWITESIMPLMTKSVKASNNRTRNYSTVLFLGSVGGSTSVFPEYRASDLMSKSAVTYLSKHLAAEHIHSNIDVFCYAPGATDTEMFRKSTLEKCSNPTAFMNSMPKQRLLDPEEIADSIYALCTEKWARIFHGGVLDASLGLGTRPGLQTETTAQRQFM